MFLILLHLKEVPNGSRISPASGIWASVLESRGYSTPQREGRLRGGPRILMAPTGEKNTLSTGGRREPRVIKNSVQRPQCEDARLWGK